MVPEHQHSKVGIDHKLRREKRIIADRGWIRRKNTVIRAVAGPAGRFHESVLAINLPGRSSGGLSIPARLARYRHG